MAVIFLDSVSDIHINLYLKYYDKVIGIKTSNQINTHISIKLCAINLKLQVI